VKISPQVNVDEIRNVAQAKAVYEITHCASQDKTQSAYPEHIRFREIAVKQENGHNTNGSNQGQQESLIYEKAECGTGIPYIGQCDTAANRYGFI